MKYLYILKTGTTFPETRARLGDFDDWIAAGLGRHPLSVRTVDVHNGAPLPPLGSARGFVITGSHAMVTDEAPWSVALERYVRRAVSRNVPLLGICYGHQLIAKALGGRSGYNPRGKEIGSVAVATTHHGRRDPILRGLPRRFSAHVTHAQSAIKLPRRARILAGNPHDPHQAVRFASCCWGVQIHPEFDRGIMQAYIFAQEAALAGMGVDTASLARRVASRRSATAILKNFAALLRSPAVSVQ